MGIRGILDGINFEPQAQPTPTGPAPDLPLYSRQKSYGG